MTAFLQLAPAVMLPMLLAIAFWWLQRKTAFAKLRYGVRQGIIGLAYGAAALVGSCTGVAVADALVSVRDAMPLCAGLLFGGPAGVIAGVIAALSRGLAVTLGASPLTMAGQALAALLSGITALVLRRFLFEGRRPGWSYALAVGLVMEIVNVLLVCLTNLDRVEQAFDVVNAGAPMMIAANALAVLAASLALTLLDRQPLLYDPQNPTIAQILQSILLVAVMVALVASSLFTYNVQTRIAQSDADNVLTQNIDDLSDALVVETDTYMLALCTQMCQQEFNGLAPLDVVQECDVPDTNKNGKCDDADLTALLTDYMNMYGVSEINVVDKNGVICASTNPRYIGFDMKADTSENQQAISFYREMQEYEQYAQPFTATAYDPDNYWKYCGSRLREDCWISGGGGFLQLGYDATRLQENIDCDIEDVARCRHVGKNGMMAVTTEPNDVGERYLISATDEVINRAKAEGRLSEKGNFPADLWDYPEDTRMEGLVLQEPSYCMYRWSNGYYVVATLPVKEALYSRNVSVLMLVFMETLLLAMLFAVVYKGISRLVVQNLQKVNHSLAQITEGNLEEKVEVYSTREFRELSQDINVTVDKLKELIAEAAARIDAELEFAKSIQLSALPNVFPPYPSHKEFTIWAGMETAREVGGDFYDFYLLGDHQLAFLIADVSGKGIPAALFMMTSKTLIKSLAETGLPADEILTRANTKLCAGNEADMFVTAWLGVLDLDTGVLEFANAGHNAPLLRQNGGEFAYLKKRSGLMLAGMEDVHYKRFGLQLNPGDTLYLYTDGVTEATDGQNRLYSDRRLEEFVNRNKDLQPRELCRAVKADVDRFVGDAPQFDDITMLCLTYHGPAESTEGPQADPTCMDRKDEQK